MSKKVTMVVNSTINPNEKEALEVYVSNASLILKAHNGTLVKKYVMSKSITGKVLAENIMLMEFKDDKIIQALEFGEEYQKLIPFRDKAFSSINISFSS